MKFNKIIISISIFIATIFIFNSCSIFRKKTKIGCPTDGRNVGAEELLGGDAKKIKKAKNAKYRIPNKV